MNQIDNEVSVEISELKGNLLIFIFTVTHQKGNLEFKKDLPLFNVDENGFVYGPSGKEININEITEDLVNESPTLYRGLVDKNESVLRKYVEAYYSFHHKVKSIKLPAEAILKFGAEAINLPKVTGKVFPCRKISPY